MASKTTHSQAIRLLEKALDRGYISQDVFDELIEFPEKNIYHQTKRLASGNRAVESESLLRRLRSFRNLFNSEDGVLTLKSARQINKASPFKMLHSSVKDQDGFKDVQRSIYSRWRILRENGELTDSGLDELFGKIRTASSLDELRGVREELGWTREAYTPERAELYGVKVGNRPKSEWHFDLKQRINTANKALIRAESTSPARTLKTQGSKLAQSVDSFARDVGIRGQKRWIRKNIHLLPEDMSVSEYADNWWRSLPNREKGKWEQVTGPIQEYNKSVIQPYHDKGEIAPTSELLQGHHVMPGGSNSPENLRGAIGNAFSDVGLEHSQVHGLFKPSAPINKFYDFMKSRGATKLYALPEMEGSPWKASPLSANWPITEKQIKSGTVRGLPTYVPLPKDLGGGPETTYGLSDVDPYPNNLIAPIDVDEIKRRKKLVSSGDARTKLGGAPARFTGLMSYIPRAR